MEKKMFFVFGLTVLLFGFVALLFEDNIAVITSKISNYVNENRVPSCQYRNYLLANKTFKPNSEFYFDGCNVILPLSHTSINSFGFRGKNYSEKKENNTLRIIAVGDSVTFGWGLNDNETFPYFLEKRLNKVCTKNVEVLNFGLPGLSAEEEFDFFKNNGIKLNPDVVIITFVGNDWENKELKEMHDVYLEKLTYNRCNVSCTPAEKQDLYFEAQSYMRLEKINLTFGEVEKQYIRFDLEKNKSNFTIVAGYFPTEKIWLEKLTGLFSRFGWENLDLTKFLIYPRYTLNIADTHPNRKATRELAEEYTKKILPLCS
jgi:lysophospholipase L1-like esterase